MKIVTPIPGTVLKILVKEGQQVKQDDLVVILQSMKTEVSISSDFDGVVKSILIHEGDEIEMGTEIAEVE